MDSPMLSDAVGVYPTDLGVFYGGVIQYPHARDRVLPLTDAKIKTLKPKDKAYKVADFEGLYLYVTPSGSRLWRMKFRHNKKEGVLSLGGYPAVTLKEARDQKNQARALLAKGINPATVKAEAKQVAQGQAENSFNRLADRFTEKCRKEGKAPATLKKQQGMLKKARIDFGNMPINEITAQVVLRTLKKAEAQGNYETAKRLRSQIGRVFRFAVACGICDNDPTYALRGELIQPQVSHQAAITDQPTLRAFLIALDGYSGKRTTIIAFWLLILFAARPGEIRNARWEEFDFEGRVWNVPAERMKMRRPHAVPLCDKALALLSELKDLTGWGELLFPAQTSAHKPISENTLNQALRRMAFGPDEATSHGFRSTFSTFANESGLWNPDAIEAYSARQDTNAVRRAYNRAAYWEERVKIAEWWAKKLADIKSSPGT